MGTIIIKERTCKDPITLIGEMAGVCYGANTEDTTKNFKRGLDCLENNHGRTLEFPDVYMIIDGYSCKFARELYTHIGGSPTRLQASTRYIDYGKKGFEVVEPHSIKDNEEAHRVFTECIGQIKKSTEKLRTLNIPKEDSSTLLPLALTTKLSAKYNLRTLIDMSHQRMCFRAYWEYREFMKDLCRALSEYSVEWKYIIDKYFKPKCELTSFCTETFSCGRKPKKDLTKE